MAFDPDERTFTNVWGVYQMANAKRCRLTSRHDTMEQANRVARSVWNQFDPRGISDGMVFCDEPNKPYHVFNCVNDNAGCLDVEVREMPLYDFNLSQLKRLARDQCINTDGCKRKKEYHDRIKAFLQPKVDENDAKLKAEREKERKKREAEKAENAKSNKRKRDNIVVIGDEMMPKGKKQKLDSNTENDEERNKLIKMGIPSQLHKYKWLYQNCNELNQESRDKIVNFMLGKYMKQDEEMEEILINRELTSNDITTDVVVKLLFKERRWTKVIRKRKKIKRNPDQVDIEKKKVINDKNGPIVID